jgi:hypothetical protein
VDVIAIGGLYSIEVQPGSSQAEIHNLITRGELSEVALDYGNHSWLEVEGLLVDPTAGQFLGPRAWDGEFEDEEPWSLDCYFLRSQHPGPFQGEWFDNKGWQDGLEDYYTQEWRRA